MPATSRIRVISTMVHQGYQKEVIFHGATTKTSNNGLRVHFAGIKTAFSTRWHLSHVARLDGRQGMIETQGLALMKDEQAVGGWVCYNDASKGQQVAIRAYCFELLIANSCDRPAEPRSAGSNPLQLPRPRSSPHVNRRRGHWVHPSSFDLADLCVIQRVTNSNICFHAAPNK